MAVKRKSTFQDVMKEGREYLDLQDWAEARAAFTEAHRMNPRSHDAFYLHAYAACEEIGSDFMTDMIDKGVSVTALGFPWRAALHPKNTDAIIQKILKQYNQQKVHAFRLASLVARARVNTHIVKPLQACLRLNPRHADARKMLDEMLPLASNLPIGGCYVATACYGDYDHPDVQLFRRFRDTRLLPTPAGRCVIALYYALSPWLAAHLPLRIAAVLRRRVLEPLARRMRG
jgi:tetratricopeptide (TPR) repeat protein